MFEVKIEMRKNVLFHFNFKLKIEWHSTFGARIQLHGSSVSRIFNF